MKTQLLFAAIAIAVVIAGLCAALGPRAVLEAVLEPIKNYAERNLVLFAIDKELHNRVKVQRVIEPLAIGANATKTGKIIDRSGYDGVEFLASYGRVTTTGTIVTLVVFEGDVTGTMTSVADADLLGTEALASLPVQASARTSEVGKNVSKRVGYKGRKRYVRVDAVGTGTTSVGCVSVEALLFNPGSGIPTNP